ncbi:MAG: S9 family peptidase [Xanthomonadales bacterium PRO6]|nr:Dipeptidyl-peptidase 5 [Xanthomonadales bacterium]MCE7932586.1 S9 family peptidase [Xanthomonadales bacterium PRO6]
MTRCLSLALAFALAAGAQARPFDVGDLVRLERISDPQLSADGQKLVYALRQTDWDANKGVQSLWQLDVGRAGAQPRRMTAPGSSAMHPRWSGDKLYFLSTRSGSAQVWVLDGPGEARQVTELPVDVGGFLLSPDGKRIALALEVYPDCGTDLECTKKRSADDEAEKHSGTKHDRLFVRHWDTWQRGTRAQLFLFDLDADGKAGGTPRWLSRGVHGDAPTKPFGDMSEVAFAPDGERLVFTARIAGKTEPWSTNTDLYEVSTRADGEPRNLTAEQSGYDTTPVYSPDGKRLYWRSMARAGYEADRNRIFERTLASGALREVAPGWDRSPDGLTLSADGRTLYAPVDDLGEHPLYAIDVRTGKTTRLTGAGNVGGYAIGERAIYAAIDDLDSPADIHRLPLRGGEATQLTAVNAGRLKDVEFGAFEQFSFKGWNDETVYAWVVKPVGFQAGQKYPIAFIVHGGPQGSMGNSFHYRWNAQTHAGKGHAAVFVDFHGSTGYGQAFTDSIRGDWGGKPLEDLRKGLAAATEKYAFLDGSRACALGGSYGGYMMNWIAGAWPEGFRCLVTHAGILDNRFMSYTTEELWFDEWEFEGTHYERPANFEKHNPVNLVKDWKTPMLVIHGMLDFRVPFEQGIAAFTAAQRRGIDSEFLWFPDENHWILKPQNSVQWHRTVEAWLARHTAAR